MPSTARDKEKERYGCARERWKLLCVEAPKPQVYIGEREGAAPPLGFPPQGVRQPQNPSRVAAKGGRGGKLPPKQGGGAPSPNPRRLGPLWRGAPAHLGLVPSHTWPIQPSGAGGPSRWTPGPFRWSRYITGDARNTSGGQILTSYISIFTSGPFRNSS